MPRETATCTGGREAAGSTRTRGPWAGSNLREPQGTGPAVCPAGTCVCRRPAVGDPPCSASTVHRDDSHASWRWVSNKAVVCILTPAAERSTGPCCAEQVPYRRMDTGGRRRRPSPIHKPAGAPSPLRALVSAPWLAPARSLSTEPPATMSFSRRGQHKVNRSERRVATLAKK